MDVPIQKKKFSNKKLGLILGVIAIIVLIVYVIMQTSGGSKLNVEKERISINTVSKDVFQENIPVNGIVLPITTMSPASSLFPRRPSISIQRAPLKRLSC